MVQETAIAAGTDVMFSDEANDGITDLAQAGANIDNLQAACPSVGGTKRRSRRSRHRRRRSRRRSRRRTSRRKIRITKRSRRSRRSRRNKTKKMRGGVFDEPVLMPPIFTKMNEYI
jgi:hypothetical protein